MNSCPCGSGQLYAACCEPYITETTPAPTAEALMRSRYSAYSLGEVDYLINSLHPSKRAKGLRVDLLESAQSTKWLRLDILATQRGGPKDKKGIVEFVATYCGKEFLSKPGQLHERSRFLKMGDRWVYTDGDILPAIELP
jgi:SEC-C motif domain protein